MTESIDVCFTFDTTGSMYPCLTQVRRTVRQTVHRLFRDIPNLRVAIIAHGDYCDARKPYVTKALNFTSDEDRICDFISDVEPTFGGDAPECYELVLNQARTLSWKSGNSKVLVVIGDDVPHGASYPENTKRIDWRNELGLLLEAGIHVYGVHAMPGIRQHSRKFYQEIAQKTGGFYLTLDQFATVTDLILAICYKQGGQLEQFQEELVMKGRMSRNMSDVLSSLLGRTVIIVSKPKKGGLIPVPAGRFQVMEVTEKQDIAGFVRDQGVSFNKGRGFYELTKPETIQGNKEIILVDRNTRDIFNGPEVRKMLGLPPQVDKKSPEREDVRFKPEDFGDYKVFVQSTSVNRALVPGTSLLYEVEDWDRD